MRLSFGAPKGFKVPTILVADDNSNIQKMVTLALQELGIHVVAVGNGEAAVRKLAEVTPDLVLADVFMPVRNGYEVCDYIKREARYSHIPVVLLIGAFDPLDEKEAHRVGANGILKKPFVPPEPLISMVTGFLAGLEKQKPAAQPAPEPVRMTPPPPPPPPAEAKQEFHQTEIEPEEFAFTRGPLSLRDGAPEIESNEQPEVASEEENKLTGSWEDRIKPQPPSPLQQQFEDDAQSETTAAWDEHAELKPTSAWQAPVEPNSPSSWGTTANEWQSETTKHELIVPEGQAPSSMEHTAPASEAETISAEEITLPGQSITGEQSKISVDAGPSQELATSPAEWMEMMSGAPTISVPPEAAETWDVTPSAPTLRSSLPSLSSSPTIEAARVKPPEELHSEPSVVIPFHSNLGLTPQTTEPAASESLPEAEEHPIAADRIELEHAEDSKTEHGEEVERPSEAFSFEPSPYLPEDDRTELLPTQQTAFDIKHEPDHEAASTVPEAYESFSEGHYKGSSIEPEPTPPATDPALVDHIVAKVLERLEPQLHAILSHELVRPLVESLLHPEVEKKER